MNEKESVGLKNGEKKESVFHKHKKVFWTTEKVNQMFFFESVCFFLPLLTFTFYTDIAFTHYACTYLTLIKCTTMEKSEKKHVELKDERKQRGYHILKLND